MHAAPAVPVRQTPTSSLPTPSGVSRQLSGSAHGGNVVEYERKEPFPLSKRPSSGILKRTPSGNELTTPRGAGNGCGAAAGCASHRISPKRVDEPVAHFAPLPTSHPHPRAHHEGVLGTLQRLSHGGSLSTAAIAKRQSFSDQHGLDLSTVHEVPDTHYKRNCLQRHAAFVACVVCVLFTVGCIVAVVLAVAPPGGGRRH
ncbi:hypothetical protein KFE25_004567 [Diacronema lutheri]|uniref:Transmembrane protein n=2 Tax=Diacronema lutheri TaxID=2081491 RepID=A0A8J6BZI3_DIALT|nr:hypothetical protein KFE25_004567 [Diacronema lutheri]